jgi:uncharacterized protein DUF2721
MPVDSNVVDITHAIQLAIAPVFLLTAIGTIISVLISRLGRAVDRRRVLEEHLPDYSGDDLERARRELAMLGKRVILVLWSVSLAVLSALLVCLLVVTAFAGAFIAFDLSRPVATLFIASVAALTACLLIFLREIAIAAVSARQTVSPQLRRNAREAANGASPRRARR